MSHTLTDHFSAVIAAVQRYRKIDEAEAGDDLDLIGCMVSDDNGAWVQYADIEARAASVAAEPALLGLTAPLSDPNAVHLNMLRGTIAKPTLDQIIHIYGRDALLAALEPAPEHAAALAEALRLLLDSLHRHHKWIAAAEKNARTALAAYDASAQTAPKTGVSDAQQTDSGRDQECG